MEGSSIASSFSDIVSRPSSYQCTIEELSFICSDVFILKIKPRGENTDFSFIPGQFIGVTNPDWRFLHPVHYFSIASSPKSPYIELCVKIFGEWTKSLSKKKAGEYLEITEPKGKFIFDTKKESVFLAGGVGIVPFMSMLRSIEKSNRHKISILYGSRNLNSIYYKKEIEETCNTLKIKLVHILSDEISGWKGYNGFITEDMIRHEIKNVPGSTFFICGPPVFVTKMEDILSRMSVKNANIKRELLTRI